jgi:hypothetical protein
MTTRPKVHVTSAAAKSVEVSGKVTVGPESAALLSKKLGRKVEVGEQFDLGVLATYNKNPLRRIWSTLKIKKHLFN